MISGYPQFTRGQCPITQVPALQALLACEHRFTKPVHDREPNHQLTIKRKRSVGVRNGGDNQHEGLGNPHPHSIVNGTIGDLEGARPTVIRPPVIVYDHVPKHSGNPFSWSAIPTAIPAAKPPAKTGRVLLAESAAAGRRAALCPGPAAGVAPAPRG